MPGGPPVLPSPRLPKKRLLDLAALISGVQVTWTTSRNPLVGLKPLSEKAWLLVGMQSYIAVGVDELRTRWNATTQQNEQMQVGQRQFTMVLTARSLDPTLEAFDLLERCRFRLRTAAARALMVPDIALRDVQQIVTLDEVAVAGRALLTASMDVRMSCVIAQDPVDPGEGNWIGTAVIQPGAGTLIP